MRKKGRPSDLSTISTAAATTRFEVDRTIEIWRAHLQKVRYIASWIYRIRRAIAQSHRTTRLAQQVFETMHRLHVYTQFPFGSSSYLRTS